jgi:hypothetical protein
LTATVRPSSFDTCQPPTAPVTVKQRAAQPRSPEFVPGASAVQQDPLAQVFPDTQSVSTAQAPALADVLQLLVPVLQLLVVQ